MILTSCCVSPTNLVAVHRGEEACGFRGWHASTPPTRVSMAVTAPGGRRPLVDRPGPVTRRAAVWTVPPGHDHRVDGNAARVGGVHADVGGPSYVGTMFSLTPDRRARTLSLSPASRWRHRRSLESGAQTCEQRDGGWPERWLTRVGGRKPLRVRPGVGARWRVSDSAWMSAGRSPTSSRTTRALVRWHRRRWRRPLVIRPKESSPVSRLLRAPDTSVGGVVHGTTVVTNALLEGRGATVTLVTTEGFRDVLEIGRLAPRVTLRAPPAGHATAARAASPAARSGRAGRATTARVALTLTR